jgi:hypothetical protein
VTREILGEMKDAAELLAAECEFALALDKHVRGEDMTPHSYFTLPSAASRVLRDRMHGTARAIDNAGKAGVYIG